MTFTENRVIITGPGLFLPKESLQVLAEYGASLAHRAAWMMSRLPSPRRPRSRDYEMRLVGGYR